MKRTASTLEIGAFLLLILGVGAFVAAVRARTNWDQDIWWHIRTGQWIVEHGGVPITDPFSQYGRDKAWVEYSWLFDVIAHFAYQASGLRGLVVLSAGLSVLIAASLYVCVRGLGAPLTVAAPLTLVGFDAIMPLTTPRPWLFSMLLLLIEVHVIVTAMRRPTAKIPWVLWLLPLIFVLWANLHIQFIIGLMVLGAAAADAVWYAHAVPRCNAGDMPGVPVTTWLLVGAACVGATLLNPYAIGVYVAARDLLAQTQLWTRISELMAPDFRNTTTWVALVMVLTAAAAMGWQGSRRPVRVFLLLLFVLGVYLGFKSRRDMWVTVTTAACVMAAATAAMRREWNSTCFPGWLGASVAVPAAALVVVAAPPLLSEEQLASHVARTYPVAAAAFVAQQGHSGPLYNYFDWGGYLMWRLPHVPVQMDGRALVHGEARIVRHVDTWQGKPGWRDDPELAAAKIVVGPRDLPLISLLRLDERFRLTYEDPEGPAVVFEAR